LRLPAAAAALAIPYGIGKVLAEGRFPTVTCNDDKLNKINHPKAITATTKGVKMYLQYRTNEYSAI
jgi:hypothetical protein